MSEYLIQRNGSKNWYVLLQKRKAGKIIRIEKSLRTDDKALALLKAQPYIQAHKANVELLRSEPAAPKLKPAEPKHHGDEDRAIIETWASHQDLNERVKADALRTYETFRKLCGKSLKRASRDDGRALARHLLDKEGLKSGTVQKLVGYLRAACNLAIEEGKLRSNPFIKVVPARKDATERQPLSFEDMAACRKRLLKLDPEDQALWILLATTGMRLGEAFQISEEKLEHVMADDNETVVAKVRYVTVGTKTEASKRNVPLPKAVIELYPEPISGPLFADCSAGAIRSASKRLNRFLRNAGIKDERKTLHSLRHRAKDRLRTARCPLDVQYFLLGHEEKTVAAGYGIGYPLDILKEWVDRIGY